MAAVLRPDRGSGFHNEVREHACRGDWGVPVFRAGDLHRIRPPRCRSVRLRVHGADGGTPPRSAEWEGIGRNTRYPDEKITTQALFVCIVSAVEQPRIASSAHSTSSHADRPRLGSPPSHRPGGPSMSPPLWITATPPASHGELHIGHLAGPYVAADVLSRHLRADGRPVLFSTGTADHTDSVELRAVRGGRKPEEVAEG